MTAAGTYLHYVDTAFKPETLDFLRRATTIIDEYEASGYTMTVRQLHYQHVARNLYQNTKANYDRLKGVIAQGRMAGLVSWTAIEDVTRYLRGHDVSEGALEAVQAQRDRFIVDRWRGQQHRPFALIEKDALLGVIGSICSELSVDYGSCRGYSSASELWRMGQRLAGVVRDGQRPIVLHLGDHDPSGLDMTRDLQERLSLFAGTPVMVARLALNRDQIEKYNPPPNDAKLRDSRADDYVAEHGYSSWELDALAPDVIHTIISDAVLRVRDHALWDERLAEEAMEKRRLNDVIEQLGGASE